MREATNPRTRRALVVDDDDTMVEFVSRALRGAGYEVDSCGDGMTALAQFRAAPYDAVVIDMRMPRLSGTSFLKNLRLSPGASCRVVMLSSLDDARLKREALEAGAVAYLVKPASAQTIVEAVIG